jgi:hypothetical protein
MPQNNEDFSKQNVATNLAEYFRKYAQKILSFVNLTKKFELPKSLNFQNVPTNFRTITNF